MTGEGAEPQGDREPGDPVEHPEQHAARQTGEQGEATPDTDVDNEDMDSEQHSNAEGPFGTG